MTCRTRVIHICRWAPIHLQYTTDPRDAIAMTRKFVVRETAGVAQA
jgi:hypothetical protein